MRPQNLASSDAVVWQPIPGSSQALALDTRCHHTLYTGARGPGKTDCQLMRFRRRVGVGYGTFWKGVIFDREYKNLDDLVGKSKRWFPKFNDGCRFLESKGDFKWIWPTGEELLFRSIKKAEDYWNFHGHEYPFIGWNELAKYPTAELYDKMMSCNRSSFTPEKDSPDKDAPLDDIPLEVFSTTNPYGPGHNWVKQRFIAPAPYGNVVRTTSVVFDPRLQAEREVTKTQVAIFGSYRENIYLSAEYVAELDNITDENQRQAWLFGNWDIVAGGALDDVWSALIKLPRFKIPATWRVDRAFDWGSTHPWWCGWFAETNGEEVTFDDGFVFRPPPRSLILIDEIYGSKLDPKTRLPSIGTNVGDKSAPADIAVRIREREIELMAQGLIATQPEPGPADNQIRNVQRTDIDTIEKVMADEGVRWTESDKSPGSRKNGLQLVRDMCEATKKDKEKPRFYAFTHCRATHATLPSLPRGEGIYSDDVDTGAEDHPYDGIRYRVLAGSNRFATHIKTSIAH